MDGETNATDTQDAPLADAGVRLTTRRDCTVLGAKVFAACVAAGVLAPVLPTMLLALATWPTQALADDSLRFLLTAEYVAVPPAAAIGAAIGFELYRLAARSREPREFGCLVWIGLALCVLGYSAPFVYYQCWRRKKAIIEGRRVGWCGAIIYGLILVLFAVAWISKAWPWRWDVGDAIIVAILGGVASLFLADCIVVNLVANLYQQERLAVPHTHNIQYSLATLLYGTLAIGAYGTGLVLIFGK